MLQRHSALYIYIDIDIDIDIDISETSYFGESHDPVLKQFWKESLS